VVLVTLWTLQAVSTKKDRIRSIVDIDNFI